MALPELSGSRRATTKGVCERGKSSAITRKLSTLADEHRKQGRSRQGHERTVAFGHDVLVLAAASLALVSARERSRVISRGWWRGAAVVGELWLEHALNRGAGATQSASNACQPPCPHAVTALAWSRRHPSAAKPCLRSSPHSV